ncbi:MAG TPA: hypothetical protein DIW17_00470 [Clostridiales bacterium]|nr:hypothetical protein [Clostridiales bacterium]
MNKDSKVFFRMVRDFLTVYLPKQKASSPNTIRSYRTAINQYLDYSCRELKISLSEYSFQHSSRQLIEEFLEQMEIEQRCSVASRNQRLAAIRRFYRYAAERDPSLMSCYHELSVIPLKKQKAEHEIEFFSEIALEAILAEPDSDTRKGIRDLMFMILLYDTGARLQEILDLHLNNLHIDSDDRYVILTGKGNKTRLVPLMQKTIEHLNKYISLFHSGNRENPYLFYIERKGKRNQMSQDNVSKFIKKYGALAREKCPEVPENLYTHMFRHSRSMHLYRNGMPLPLLSEWLGHAQMETTIKYYANADIRMKQEAIEKATSELNPLLSSQTDFTFKDDEETLKKLYGLM